MNYTTVYVGMDVHKETFSLCCYTNEKEQAEYCQKVDADITVKSSTTWKPCALHYGRGCKCLYAVMKQAALAITLYHQLTEPSREVRHSCSHHNAEGVRQEKSKDR